MDYKVSVIIPAYNAEKTLERAFLSVKNQTIGFGNIELLLCDDCSTDGSYSMIEKWAAEYPNVRALKTKKNSGAAGAPRNIGLDNATAPYVMFLDSDDEYFPNACELLCNAAVNNGAGLVGGNYLSQSDDLNNPALQENETRDKEIGSICKKGNFSDDKDFGITSFIYYCNFWTKLYRTNIIRENAIRFPEGAFLEDFVFYLEYITVCESYELLADRIVLRHEIDESLSHQSRFFWITRAKAISDGADWAKKQGRYKEYISLVLAFNIVDGSLMILETADFDDDYTAEILMAMKPMFRLFEAQESKRLKTNGTRILVDDVLHYGASKALYDFKLIKQMNAERKTELDNIFGSTSWRIASLIQKLKFWSK